MHPSQRAWPTVTRRTLLAAGTSGLLAACAGTGSTAGGAAPSDRLGRVIPVAARRIRPSISGVTLDGRELDTRSWRGAPVVVNFWGSWCAPCREEAPQLRAVALATLPLGVHFVGIDMLDDPAAGKAFMEDFKLPYPSIRDDDGVIETRFGAAVPRAVPTTHVLDAEGRVAVQFLGKITVAGLQPTVLQVLSETNPRLGPASSAPVGSRSPASPGATGSGR